MQKLPVPEDVIHGMEGPHLRIYPIGFGKEIASLMPKLATRGEGKPLDKEMPTHVPAHIAFAAAPWEDWSEANLKEVMTYLRGNKSLELPQFWRDVLPMRL